MKEITFSIVILSFNSKKYLDHTLKSIDESVANLKQHAEVFIVDNGSNDGSTDLLKSFNFNSSFIHYHPTFLDKNYGTTYSRNLALKKVKGKYIVIMDSDAYMNTEAMDELGKFLKNDPECGLVVPKLIYPDGRSQLSVDHFPTVFNKIKRLFFLKKMEKKSQPLQLQNVDYAISAFWMFPKSILDKVGLLDEKIFYSPEDVDFCIRIWKAGFKIVFFPHVSIVHDAQEISRPKGLKIINRFTLSHAKGLLYLFIKHRYLFSPKI